MRVFFHTLGCKLNQAETEALAASFSRQGIEVAVGSQPPDVIIINTCTVTSKSEQKARRVIRGFSAQYPDALVIITGCYAQVEYEYLRANFTEHDHAVVVSQQHKDILLRLPDFLREHPEFTGSGRVQKQREIIRWLKEETPGSCDVFAFHTPSYNFHSRAFLKIQDGCNNSCAYCRVPLARGRSQSLEVERVQRRVAELVRSGFREIVLTGVNIGSYDSACYDLKLLLRKLLKSTRYVRFRLSSLEPESIDDELCEVLADNRVCAHFHLPIQSGAEKVLKAMRRRSSPETIRRAAALLHRARPDALLTADVITGFPGESQKDFMDTATLIKEIGLHKLHVFPFSARPGTTAFTMENKLPSAVIKERSMMLLELSRKLYSAYLLHHKGRQVAMVLERKMNGAGWQGSGENSVKYRLTQIPPMLELGKGMLVAARAAEVNPDMTCNALFLSVEENPPLFI
ncbi:MAG: tRNA (N(6)-L-threonylcarbamoyladenosine(37)-C(2))-methylthiotransferase MtaB [Spirochaetia bacterium]